MRNIMKDEKLVKSQVCETVYIHEIFSSMFHGMLDWFQSKFEPRFAYKVISTYDKAVQFFNSKRHSKDGIVTTNILPSITLDPNLDFINEERSGKFLWMFNELDGYRQRSVSPKINLRDQGVVISVNHTRYSGTCDVTFWLSSIYELFDFRTKLIQFCGGTGRWIRPEFFWSHLILPKEIVEFNDTPSGKKIDWRSTPLEMIQFKTTNSREYAVPYNINAIWRLDSVSDGSVKYGADQVSEWKLTATFTWEANIPTFIRLDNYAFYNMRPTLNFHLGPAYSSQPLIDNIKTIQFYSKDQVLDQVTKNNTIYIIDNKDQIISPIVKLDNTQCQHYPLFYTNYDHIVSGKLYTKEWLIANELPNEDFIALIDYYDPDICDDFLNAAKGCICKHDDSSSRFFSKVSALKIPTICHFDEKLYNYLVNQNGNDITMDSISKLIFSGIYKSKIITDYNSLKHTDYYAFNNIMDVIKNGQNDDILNDPEYRKLNFGENSFITYNRDDIIGKIDTDTMELDLPYSVPISERLEFEVYADNIQCNSEEYEIIGTKIRFNEKFSGHNRSEIRIVAKGLSKVLTLQLAIDYHMTKTDERNYYTEGKKIELEIPQEFEKQFIRCFSYKGSLVETIDYNIVDNKVIFELEPMRDKVIQVYANRI